MKRLAAAIVGISLAACATTPSSRCADPGEEQCWLSFAEASLGDIQDPLEWVAAASEFSLALNAAGEPERAEIVLAAADSRLSKIADPAQRIDASLQLARAFRECGVLQQARRLTQDSQGLSHRIEKDDARWDRLGHVAAELAALGDIAAALDIATEMAEGSPNQASFKARTLGDIAVHQAEHGRLRDARRTLSAITMGLAYYQSTARSRIALLAPLESSSRVLSEQAARIARSQDSGYFSAGALRQVAAYEFSRGRDEQALALSQEAAQLARTAPTAQERARAVSRLATALSDHRQYGAAVELLEGAELSAEGEESEPLRYWSYYEIAGSAAFSGDFERAQRLLDAIPDSTEFGGKSVKSAAQRDVVWGLIRHGQREDAMQLAKQIAGPRERVQAFSRAVRLIRTRHMPAHPRYL